MLSRQRRCSRWPGGSPKGVDTTQLRRDWSVSSSCSAAAATATAGNCSARTAIMPTARPSSHAESPTPKLPHQQGASSAPSGNDVLGCAAVDVYGPLHGTEVAFSCRDQVDLRQPGKPVSQVRAPASRNRRSCPPRCALGSSRTPPVRPPHRSPGTPVQGRARRRHGARSRAAGPHGGPPPGPARGRAPSPRPLSPPHGGTALPARPDLPGDRGGVGYLTGQSWP